MDVLDEAVNLKGFLASLWSSKPKKPMSSAALREKAETVISGILKSSKFKARKRNLKKQLDGQSYRIELLDGKKPVHLLKGFLNYETGHFGLSLWTADGQDLLQIVTIGYLQKYARAMEVVGISRMASLEGK